MRLSFLRRAHRGGIALASAAMLLTSACGGTAAPASPASQAATKPAAASGSFQAQWDALVAAAKQEGKLSIGFSPNPPLEQQILPAFEKQFGVQVEQVKPGSATALSTKLVQEKAAGVHSLDVLIGSCAAVATIAYPGKLYANLKDQIILPEASDPSKWVGGKVPYMDNEQAYVLRLDRQVRYFFHDNPSGVDLTQLKSSQDLLNPALKGKIGSLDVTGLAGQSEAAIFLKLKGDDFVKQLYTGQNVKFATDQRILGDWIAKNQYPIGIALPVDEYVSLKGQGLPVQRLKLSDLTAQTTAVLLPGIMDGAPHPNAAKLFVNWALSKDGMQAFSNGIQEAMMRTDLDYSKLNPDDVPAASSNYFDDCTMDYNTTERLQLNDRLKADLGR